MANILNYIFGQFEYFVCFAPLSYEVERKIILDLCSTAGIVKSKRGSGDIPTRRVCLSDRPHGSVVGAPKFYDLGTLVDTEVIFEDQ